MVSTPTTRNKFRKPASGDFENAWAPEINEDVFDRIDQALDGVLSVDISGSSGGTYTLTTTNYEDNEYRNRHIILTGALTDDTEVAVPDVERWWFFANNTTGSYEVTLKNTTDEITLERGRSYLIFSDGTNLYDSGFVTQDDIDSSLASLASVPLSGSSTSSVTIGTGSKTFTVAEASARLWGAGQRLRISRTSFGNTTWMTGTITSYSHPSLTVNVDGFSGSGSVSSWRINITGETGALSVTDANAIAEEQAIIFAIALGGFNGNI